MARVTVVGGHSMPKGAEGGSKTGMCVSQRFSVRQVDGGPVGSHGRRGRCCYGSQVEY